MGSWFLLGGAGHNCLHFFDSNIHYRAPMPSEISFFPAVSVRAAHIYTFGGYDHIEKTQLRSIEVYSVAEDRWHRHECLLNTARSQASCCLLTDSLAFVFGGYNKDQGTLDSIERFDIAKKTLKPIELKMPSPLRRFAAAKISQTKILLLGGVTKLSKDSDAVYCFDCDEEGRDKPRYSVESLDKIDKAGVIDAPVIMDSVGSLELFLEQSSGTQPMVRSVYSFLEYS